jgi:hypothetical protein
MRLCEFGLRKFWWDLPALKTLFIVSFGVRNEEWKWIADVGFDIG